MSGSVPAGVVLDDSPVLTLSPGLELAMSPGIDILVGATPGGLVASDVAFADAPCTGIRFLESTTVGTLDEVRVVGIGGPVGAGGLIGAGVLLRDSEATVTIAEGAFSDDVVDISVDSGSTSTLTGNTATVARESGC